jgi:hypothetical protein
MLEMYFQLPYWARRELHYCDIGWQYSGNDLIGWNLDYQSGLQLINIYEADKSAANQELFAEWTIFNQSRDSVWRDGINQRIPSNPRFYGEKIRDLFDPTVDLNVDVFKLEDKICMQITVELWGEKTVLTGAGDNATLAAMNLYLKSAEAYHAAMIPGLPNLEGVSDTWLNNGEVVVDFKSESDVAKAFNKYKRFAHNIECLPVEHQMPSMFSGDKNHQFYFDLLMIEGIAKIYSNYGSTSNQITFSVGNNNIIGNTYSNTVMGGYVTTGGSYVLTSGGAKNSPSWTHYNTSTLSVGSNIQMGTEKKGSVNWTSPKK